MGSSIYQLPEKVDVGNVKKDESSSILGVVATLNNPEVVCEIADNLKSFRKKSFTF